MLRLGFGIFLALNIMVASWLSYSWEVFGTEALAQGNNAALPSLFSYLAFFLCTLLLAVLAMPLLGAALGSSIESQNAVPQGTARRLPAQVNAQVLILLGVIAAYLLSVVHTFRGEGSLYYDTAAMVLVIVTLGSYLEAGAKRRASSSASQLLAALPSSVRVRRGSEVCELPITEVRYGDLVQIRPGETLAVDGEVVEGMSRVDEASLTGESRLRSAAPGAHLLAGVMSLDGQLWLRAERVGEDTVLALMERSLAAARLGRPKIQRQADRVAAVFTPAVVALALVVFVHWAWLGQPGEGLLTALAVLLISCPCALGLAAPLACWHGLRRAAEHGILIDSAETLERAAAVDRVFFDKTGTLTQPQPTLEGIAVASGTEPQQALLWAASLEAASTHPIGQAILVMANEHGLNPLIPQASKTVPGLGVEGRVEGRLLRLGSALWVERCGLAEHPLAQGAEDDGLGAVFLMHGERLLARFDLAENVRPEAASAVIALRRMGIEVGILSGDRQAPTRRLARQLGVSAEGELLPDAKERRLHEARLVDGCLAMVGDGMNDGPVLAAADVGIALGSASDLARRSGNVRLLNDRLDRVPLLLQIARDVRRRIRLNLWWSFGFNSLGIGLAVTGWLTPVFAAVAMLFSSLTVVWVSSRAGQQEVDIAVRNNDEASLYPGRSQSCPVELPMVRGDHRLGQEG